MSNSDFQVNDYADRVAEITTVYRTESKDIVEVEGFWADTGSAFDRQYLPSAMRLAAGDLVFVIQQVKGPRGVGTWVGFQSAKAPKIYRVSTQQSAPKLGIIDRAGGASNALIELGAVAALGWVGWQHSWWLAGITGTVAAYFAADPHIAEWFTKQDRQKSAADESLIFSRMPKRLADLSRTWGNARFRNRTGTEAGCDSDDAASQPSSWREVLGLGPDCSAEEAERAGRSALKDYHPDRHMSLPAKLRERAEAETRLILEALEEARRYFGQVR